MPQNNSQKIDIGRIVNSIICGDTLETLKQMPSDFVDMVMTSPPY